MKCAVAVLFLCVSAACSHAQTTPQTISSAQLQAVLDLPLDQAVKLRETYKVPLRAAYFRQTALAGEDCKAAVDQGQQLYNICMGHADEQADQDFAVFYNHLQMLCHDQEQLTAMHAFRAAWLMYKESAMKATRASWPDGTAAPGVAVQVYLALVRNHMQQLDEIYDMNISQ